MSKNNKPNRSNQSSNTNKTPTTSGASAQSLKLGSTGIKDLASKNTTYPNNDALRPGPKLTVDGDSKTTKFKKPTNKA